MKIIVLAGLLASSSFAAPCVPVTGDRILGRDLALANPAFAALPSDLTIGYSPAPGSQRIFAATELARIARANRIDLPVADEVCFTIPMHDLAGEEILTAMRHVLPVEAELSLVELPKTKVPAGAIEFPLTAMEPVVQGARLWRGYVRYGQTLRMNIWARVSVRYPVEAVVAAADLPPNVPIEVSRLRVQIVNAPIEHGDRLAKRVEEVLGRIPTRSISAGSPIPLAYLDTAPAVRRGDAVKVEVRSGPARIQIDAVAEQPARTGDMVELRNPVSGKKFLARLESDAHAVIVIGGSKGL